MEQFLCDVRTVGLQEHLRHDCAIHSRCDPMTLCSRILRHWKRQRFVQRCDCMDGRSMCRCPGRHEELASGMSLMRLDWTVYVSRHLYDGTVFV